MPRGASRSPEPWVGVFFPSSAHRRATHLGVRRQSAVSGWNQAVCDYRGVCRGSAVWRSTRGAATALFLSTEGTEKHGRENSSFPCLSCFPWTLSSLFVCIRGSYMQNVLKSGAEETMQENTLYLCGSKERIRFSLTRISHQGLPSWWNSQPLSRRRPPTG